MPYNIGQTATNPKTGQKVQWDGTNWVAPAGQTLNTTGGYRNGKFSPQAQSFLNTLSQQAADAGETRRVYDRAKQDVRTLQPGPFRGKFLDMALPSEGGGILDTIGAAVVGVPAKVLGAIKPAEVDAYQHMKGLQSQQVLQAQLAQKGPQTESDAARMALTEISPNKTADVNNDVINKGIAKTDRLRAKAIFYTHFANKYGLNGVSPHGYTADQLWASDGARITESLFGNKPAASNAPAISILSRTKVR
jgi:hypothetical protein